MEAYEKEVHGVELPNISGVEPEVLAALKRCRYNSVDSVILCIPNRQLAKTSQRFASGISLLSNDIDVSVNEAKRIILCFSWYLLRRQLPLFDAPGAQLCVAESLQPVDANDCMTAAGSLVNVTHLLQNGTSIPSGSGPLDGVLGGGLPCGCVTEIVGSAGIGKTRCCLHFAAVCSLRHGMPVVWIDVDAKFPAKVFRDMLMAKSIIHRGEASDGHSAVRSALSQVAVVRGIRDVKDFFAMRPSLELLALSRGAKLIVVDSIFTIVQRTFSPDENVQRSEALMQILSALKCLAEASRAAVVVTNHNAAHSSWRNATRTQASLGNSFHHGVNLRLALEARPDGIASLRVVKAPMCDNCEFDFFVGDGNHHEVVFGEMRREGTFERRIHGTAPAASRGVSQLGSFASFTGVGVGECPDSD